MILTKKILLIVNILCCIVLAGYYLAIFEKPDSWIGSYRYFEFFKPNINMAYNIDIYKEQNSYFATIEIDGFQTIKRIKANISGNQNAIQFLFEEYLSENAGEPYRKGDLLLCLYKKDRILYTEWNIIKPIVYNNKALPIYFKKWYQ